MSVNSSTISLLGNYPYYKLAALFFSVILSRRLKKGKDGNSNGLPLPPGHKGYPLIGNIFDMSTYKPWFVFEEWRKTMETETGCISHIVVFIVIRTVVWSSRKLFSLILASRFNPQAVFYILSNNQHVDHLKNLKFMSDR